MTDVSDRRVTVNGVDYEVTPGDLWLDTDGDLWQILDAGRMTPVRVGTYVMVSDPGRTVPVRHIGDGWYLIGPDRRRENHPVNVDRRARTRPPRMWQQGLDDTEVGRAKLHPDPVIDTSTRAAALSAAVGESESEGREHLAHMRMMGPAVRDDHLKGAHGLETPVIDASFAAVHRLLHETVGPGHVWQQGLDDTDTDPASDMTAVVQQPGGVHAAQVGQTWRVDRPPIIGKVVEITRDSTGKVIRGMLLNGADTIGGVVWMYPAEDEPRYTFTLVADVEPEYEPGSMWVDADGRSWIRSVNGRWWFVGPGNDGGRVPGDSAAHTIPTRPLSLASR